MSSRSATTSPATSWSDAYARDAIQIAGTGGLPLIVLLTDHRDGKALSLVATVGIPPPLQEQIAVIEATDATLN